MFLRRLIRCTAGTSAIEYAVIASLVSIAGIAAFLTLGGQSESQLAGVNAAYEKSNNH
jgi:Flp pilus assembly pilin Flp